MRWFGLTIALLALLSVHTSAYPRIRRQAELRDSDNLTPLSKTRQRRSPSTSTSLLPSQNRSSLTNQKSSPLTNQKSSSLTNQKSSPLTNQQSSPLTSLNGRDRRFISSTFLNSNPTTRRPKPSTTTEDIPVFDRNRVSLDLPGSLFGPSVSLLIRSTKIVGSVIQNSAERYQTFLRLFRPLFRGVFEIKGLDPITTTTPKPSKRTAKKATSNGSSEKPISKKIRR